MPRIEDSELSVREAVAALERLGSDDDPIRYRGEECSPKDLPYMLDGYAKEVRISYFAAHVGKHRGVRWVRNGTLTGMLRDRRRLPLAREVAQPRRKHCPTCRCASPF